MAQDLEGRRGAAGQETGGRRGGAVGCGPDLERVTRQALADAEATGRDYLTQTEEAVRAVLRVRPDMTASEALAAVDLVRRS